MCLCTGVVMCVTAYARVREYVSVYRSESCICIYRAIANYLMTSKSLYGED